MRRASWLVKVLVVLATALAIPAYLVLKSVYQTSTMSWPRQRFAAEAWRASPKLERFRFFRDLRNRCVLERMARQDVARLLGPPDSDQGPYWTYAIKGRSEREYSLNMVYVMCVNFNDAGRVVSVSMMPD